MFAMETVAAKAFAMSLTSKAVTKDGSESDTGNKAGDEQEMRSR